MTPRRLRIRVLTILGLPMLACTKQAQSGGEGGPTVLDIPPVSTVAPSTEPNEDELDEELFTHPAAKAFDCGPDRARAVQCGVAYGAPEKPAEAPYQLCSETARSLSTHFYIGRAQAAAPFDPVLTSRFRKFKKDDQRACCYSECVDVKSVAKAAPVPPGWRTTVECMASIRRGARHPADGRADCPTAVDFGSGPGGSYAAPFHPENTTWREKEMRRSSGFEELNLCCYQDVRRYSRPVRGRALRGVGGEILVAPSLQSQSWASTPDTVVVEELGPRAREELAARWQRDAELEHASVASFAQLSLALMALGAPPELLVACHQSALDEIRHAELCYGMASTYAGVALGPGPLAPPSAPASDVVQLAVETFRDGCVGETAAALIAARSAAPCRQSEVRRALETIAEDELRHGELAWRIVKWALAFDGVKEALVAECDALRREPRPPRERACPWADHGVLSEETEAAIRSEVVEQVVLPCAEALLMAA